ncbi:MAG: hypothetical protein QM621_14580 [Aeromicrobium sp.]|uniref:hypothetical protein n=1 Tax=Aeromicrobium sp. TaxID=1871063 RepID=UPI0039E4F71B
MKRTATILTTAALLFMGACGSDNAKDDTDSKDDDKKSEETIEDLDPEEILDLATEYILDADQVTLSGEMVEDDEEMEVTMSYDGDNSHGLIVTPAGEFEVLQVDGSSYFRADDAFWSNEAGAEAQLFVDALGGRWLDVTDDPDMGDLTQMTDRQSFVDEVFDAEGEVTVGDTKKVEGVECLSLSDGESPLWVALDDARPIALEAPEDEEGELVFDYDEADVPDAPSADEVTTMDELIASFG